MSRTSRRKSDPIEQEIELALEPDDFIPERACFSFVGDLEEVAAKIAPLVASDPRRAVTLYETFLAGCHEKVEALDDSGGSFGQFVGNLFCGWIRARQAAGGDPHETAARLIAWMEDDEYAFWYKREKDAAEVLDAANLAAFVTQVRARLAAARAATQEGDARRQEADYERRRWGSVLRALYAAQRDVAAYVALAEEDGLTADDCREIATLLAGRRHPEEALRWVERGIDLAKKVPHESMAGLDLAKLKRDLLVKLGRSDEALAAAWGEFRSHPSKYSYADLMKYVPEAERHTWRAKAIEVAMAADLASAMELLLATKELDRLADLVARATDAALEGLSHFSTEPVARRLEKLRPDLGARLWRAQGLRIVNAKKSKYYDAALADLERAKRCYERAGLGAEWQRTVSQVQTDHHRKSGFMAGFERLVSGVGPSDEPSFLERAKARWSGREPNAEDQG